MLRGWHRVPLPVKGRFRAGPSCPGPSLLPFLDPLSSPLKEDNFYWLEVGRGWGDLSGNVPPLSLAPSVLPFLLDYFHQHKNGL